jgi:hypothetical protein
MPDNMELGARVSDGWSPGRSGYAAILRSRLRWRAAAQLSNVGSSGAIEALAPLAGETTALGGSRAQHDLIEFTLLKPLSTRVDRRNRGVCLLSLT